MKKTYLFIIIIFIFFFNVKSQVTYFNYLDYTVEWRYYYSYLYGASSNKIYQTHYIDGDTLINGKYYYKKYASIIDSMIYSIVGSYPKVSFSISGPQFIREDSALKFWEYSISSNKEEIFFDSHKVINLQVNDTLPGEMCTVKSISMLLLGNRALKECHSNLPIIPNSILEGVGQLGSLCGIGIEYSGFMSCFKKQNDELKFAEINCSMFPIPQRKNTSVVQNKIETEKIKIYPNPSRGDIICEYNIKPNDRGTLSIYDLKGMLIQKLILHSNSNIKHISNLDKGIYMYQITVNDKVLKSDRLVIIK